jgi:chromosome segregation ATPase
MKSPISNIIVIVCVCVPFIIIGGCGSLKEEMASVKEKVRTLAKENSELEKRLESLEAALENAEARVKDLKDEAQKIKALSEDLQLDNEELMGEKEKLLQSYKELQEKLADLKKENQEQKQKIKTLQSRKSSSDSATSQITTSSPTDLQSRLKETQKGAQQPEAPEKKAAASREHESATPCDMVIEYMKKSGALIKELRGEARKTALKELLAEYKPKMEKAPKKAVNAAIKWVKAVDETWDKATSESVFGALNMRNKALEACAAAPEEHGF